MARPGPPDALAVQLVVQGERMPLRPVERLLVVQALAATPAPELADRLGVTTRTISRIRARIRRQAT